MFGLKIVISVLELDFTWPFKHCIALTLLVADPGILNPGGTVPALYDFLGLKIVLMSALHTYTLCFNSESRE